MVAEKGYAMQFSRDAGNSASWGFNFFTSELEQQIQLFFTQEYYIPDIEKTDPHVEAFGVGLHYFPFPNFDLFLTAKKHRDSAVAKEYHNLVWIIGHIYLKGENMTQKVILFFIILQVIGFHTFAVQAEDGAKVDASALPTVERNLSAVSVEAVVKKEERKVDSSIQFSGDFRLRSQVETQGQRDSRSIQRMQARLGVMGQVQDNLKLSLRLMSGSSANSGNQTLGDEKAPGMPRRNFGLDQAFFDYNPITSVNIYGGKMPQFFTFVAKNQIILDNDISPEGWGFKYSEKIADPLEVFVNGGTFLVKENYDSQFGVDLTDNYLNAGQVGLQWKPGEWVMVAGLGSFAYIDLKGNRPDSIVSSATGNGNTLDINGNYPTNFDLDEYFVEIKRKWGTIEASLFYETVSNRNAFQLNEARAFGLQAKYDMWTFAYLNKEVEKDAVVGAFTDSDFGGCVTSVRGAVWTLGYKLTKKVQIQYALLKNETAIDLTPVSYDRSHLDLSISF